MISLDCLKTSIFKGCYFSRSIGKLELHNEECQTSNVLSRVDVISKGTFISMDNKMLKASREAFQPEDKDAGRISFCRDCDGICLLELNGRNILLIIEIKSGFNEIKKKGFDQLVASYIKTRCILQSINGYNPEDYEEVGLLISYPPKEDFEFSPTSLIDVKSATIIPSALDKLNSKNATALRVDKEVILNLSDYKLDACHVNPSLYKQSLYVKHISVKNLVGYEKIDIDLYL